MSTNDLLLYSTLTEEIYEHVLYAVLQVLRHLGRINETRVGHHRVIILQKPH